MQPKLGSIAAMALATGVAGCTTRLTSSLENQGPYTKAPGGTVVQVGPDYGLPMLQFTLKVRRTLIECESGSAASVRYLAKVEAEPRYVVGERPSVDYEKLSGWSKTSKFELQTYDSGVLKSINAQAEDHSKAIVASVVKSGVSIFSLASGVPLNLSQLPGKPKLHVCTKEAKALLALVDTTTKTLKAQTSKLTELTEEVARLERSAGINALNSQGKESLNTAQKQVAAQAKLTAETDKALAGYVDRLSASEELVWPRLPSKRTDDISPNARSKRQLDALFEEAPKDKDGNYVGGFDTARIEAARNMYVRLAPVIDLDKTCEDAPEKCSASEVAPKDASGLLYRSPVMGQLLVCQVSSDSECAIDGASGVVVTATAVAPQLGRLRVLPFRNGIFQNNELKATFREDGNLATVNYDEKTARGLELAESVANGLDQIVAARDAERAYKEKQAADQKAEDEAKKKAELDALDDEIARLEKLKKINDLNAQATQTTSVSDMQAETARLNAQLALLEAQRKVREAQAALAGAAP